MRFSSSASGVVCAPAKSFPQRELNVPIRALFRPAAGQVSIHQERRRALSIVPVIPVTAIRSGGLLIKIRTHRASARRPFGTTAQPHLERCFSSAESVTTATAPAWNRLIDKPIPSLVSPAMARTKTPGFTRREAYSHHSHPGPRFARGTSAPSSNCWKVIAQNYMYGQQQAAMRRQNAPRAQALGWRWSGPGT